MKLFFLFMLVHSFTLYDYCMQPPITLTDSIPIKEIKELLFEAANSGNLEQFEQYGILVPRMIHRRAFEILSKKHPEIADKYMKITVVKIDQLQ